MSDISKPAHDLIVAEKDAEIERLKSGWREAFKINMDRQTDLEQLRVLIDELTGGWTGSDIRGHIVDYPHHDEAKLLELIANIRHRPAPAASNRSDDDLYTASAETIAEFRQWQKEKAGG